MIDILAQAVCENPFPLYAQLRRDNPVCQVQPGGLWLVTRYADVQLALKRTDIFSSQGFKELLAPDWLREECKRDLSILSQDPPQHTRNRVLVNRAFISRVINDLVPFMEQCAADLVATLQRGESEDFLARFAFPYAASVICKITGVDKYLSHMARVHMSASAPRSPGRRSGSRSRRYCAPSTTSPARRRTNWCGSTRW
jgi:cytochrome P450